MKKFLITAIILFIVPIWLALLFIFGQNGTAYLLNSKEKNILSIKNINLPKLYLVQSGSMAPAVGVGSVVIVSPDATYVNGDIVSFDLNGNGKNIITHRIAYKEFPNGINGEPQYVTKGDTNEDFDTTKITNKDIIGKVRLTIPYLGYLASYAKKPWGFILLVIVPATILIYEELKTIFGEARKGIRKGIHKFSKRFHALQGGSLQGCRTINDLSHPELVSGSNIKRNLLTKIFKSSTYFIPIFGAILVFVSVSASFFLDKEPSASNSFQAASSFPETLILENKKIPGDWSVLGGDGIGGTLKYLPEGPVFDYEFEGNDLIANKLYCLIYYADPWPGSGKTNSTGFLIDKGTSDSTGDVLIEGSKDIGTDLPNLDDSNYPSGAKIWLIPCTNYDEANHKVNPWAPNNFDWLFETRFIKYTRVVPSLIPTFVPTSTPADGPTSTPSPISTTIYLNQLGGDIGSQYGYQLDYTNASNNNVSFSYLTPASGKLSGTIQGSGFKPYATYQVKFSGIPTCKDSISGNDAANEYIGYKGRWTCVSANCSGQSASERNRSDSQYEVNKAKLDSDPMKECILSYLVFDHFSADSGGNASKSIQTSNSFHVLGCEGTTCGGTLGTYLTNPDSSHSTVAFCPADKVDGQLERFTCGGMTLSTGNYHLQMSLTEESFHLGNWATVLYGNIDFEIQ